MLQVCTVTPDTLELLKNLQSIPELMCTRLVGGTALAFHLGHRLSVDLDLFGEFDSEIITKTLSSKSFNYFRVLTDTKIIKHYFINKVKVDIVKYDMYQWLEDAIEEDGIRLARLKDIAAMKIAAITNRGSKKDFIDIYFLLKYFSLDEIMKLYMEKYPDGSLFLAYKSLTYFADAEQQLMPKMLIPATWKNVKSKIVAEMKRL